MNSELETGLAKLTGLAKVTSVLLWAFIALSLACTLVMALLFFTYGSGDNSEATGLAFALIVMLLIIVAVACAITVSLWIYRGHANLYASGSDDFEFKPGMVIVWYFVPILSLVRPFQAMRELWNASHMLHDSFGAPAPGEIKLWWGFWLASAFSINLFPPISLLLYAACTVLLLRIIKDITRAQNSEMNAALAFT